MARIFQNRRNDTVTRQPVITNETLFSIDFSERERQRSLSRVGTIRLWRWRVSVFFEESAVALTRLVQFLLHHLLGFVEDYLHEVSIVQNAIMQLGILRGVLTYLYLAHQEKK